MMNVISIMGRLVKDPEYSETHTGTEKATFCVAVDRDYKAQNEERAKTDFINCIAWGSTAGFIEKYFKKGQMCGVSGRLEINNIKTTTDRTGHTHRLKWITFISPAARRIMRKPHRRMMKAILQYRNPHLLCLKMTTLICHSKWVTVYGTEYYMDCFRICLQLHGRDVCDYSY